MVLYLQLILVKLDLISLQCVIFLQVVLLKFELINCSIMKKNFIFQIVEHKTTFLNHVKIFSEVLST